MPHLIVSIHHIVRKKELHKRNIQTNKEIFTICFELQSLSALLDIHMKIITLFERDNLARGLILQSRNHAPTWTVITEHTGEKPWKAA
jgi:hypothetical protein